jgi:hypothetical protein
MATASPPIARGSYEPDQLEALGKAFDDVWARVAPGIGNGRVAVETARIVLAGIMFSLSRRGNFDPRWLAENAVRVMLCQSSAAAEEAQTGALLPSDWHHGGDNAARSATSRGSPVSDTRSDW